MEPETLRHTSAVCRTGLAHPTEAVAHFAARLRHETDVSDVAADLGDPGSGIVVVDTRSLEAWQQGHVLGAVHCPTVDIPARADALGASAHVIVTYCWGPGCNGATRGALAFAQLGLAVKEMLGGYEYWVREGLPVETPAGVTARPADALTAVASGPRCDC